MNIDKNIFQGLHARAGIPQQDNYYDCGIYVCGYLHKFMENPKEFGQKLMTQQFDREEDWPDMNPEQMRASMRDILQKLAAEQQAVRDAKKALKRVKKQAAATNAGSSPPKPPLPAHGVYVDLSSPAKPRDLEPKSSLAAHATQHPKAMTIEQPPSPSRQISSTIAHQPAVKQADEEMLFQPNERQAQSPPKEKPKDLLVSLETALKEDSDSQEEKQSQHSCHIPDSQSQHEQQDGASATDFKIHEDTSATGRLDTTSVPVHGTGKEEVEFAGFSPRA
jgi:hypothetical protein